MTREEAIRILDPETRWETMQKEKIPVMKRIERDQEACRMAVAALRRKPEEIVHCRDCGHLYFKDFCGFCSHMVGIRSPDGFCDLGVRRKEEVSP